MPTFVRYHVKTGEIFSHFTTSSDEFIPLPNSEDEGIIEVQQDQLPKETEPAVPGRGVLRGKVTDGKLLRLRREPVFPVQLKLSADLEDRLGDGSLVAPADGETVINIRATIEGLGKPKDDEVATVRFRTTRGTLSHRFAEVGQGVAEVQLRAITETTEAVVTASIEGSHPASVAIEFIPVEEYASGTTEDKPA